MTQELELKSRANRLGWSLVIMLAAFGLFIGFDALVIDSIFAIPGSEKLSIATGAIFDSISYMGGFFLAAILFYVMSRKKTSEPVMFAPRFPKYLPFMIFSGIAICHSAAVLNDWFCQLIGYQLPENELYEYLSDPEIFALYMTVSLSPAFAEEILFRGVVFTNLRPYGKTFAVLTSAVLFALMHQNLQQFFYTMVAGIVMALIYEASGSIWGGVLLHMCNNLYAVLQETVIRQYDETTASVILTLAHTVLIILGTVSTVFLLAMMKKKEDIASAELAVSPPTGTFGQDRETFFKAENEQLSLKRAMGILIATPGMIVFFVLAIGMAVLIF